MSYMLFFYMLSYDTSYFQMSEFESLLFLTTPRFIIKLKKNVSIEAHKINRAKQHSEL